MGLGFDAAALQERHGLGLHACKRDSLLTAGGGVVRVTHGLPLRETLGGTSAALDGRLPADTGRRAGGMDRLGPDPGHVGTAGAGCHDRVALGALTIELGLLADHSSGGGDGGEKAQDRRGVTVVTVVDLVGG
jgi:hypothetical protein